MIDDWLIEPLAEWRDVVRLNPLDVANNDELQFILSSELSCLDNTMVTSTSIS